MDVSVSGEGGSRPGTGVGGRVVGERNGRQRLGVVTRRGFSTVSLVMTVFGCSDRHEPGKVLGRYGRRGVRLCHPRSPELA